MIKKQKHTRPICIGDKNANVEPCDKGKYICKKTLLKRFVDKKEKKAYLKFLEKQAVINILSLKKLKNDNHKI